MKLAESDESRGELLQMIGLAQHFLLDEVDRALGSFRKARSLLPEGSATRKTCELALDELGQVQAAKPGGKPSLLRSWAIGSGLATAVCLIALLAGVSPPIRAGSNGLGWFYMVLLAVSPIGGALGFLVARKVLDMLEPTPAPQSGSPVSVPTRGPPIATRKFESVLRARREPQEEAQECPYAGRYTACGEVRFRDKRFFNGNELFTVKKDWSAFVYGSYATAGRVDIDGQLFVGALSFDVEGKPILTSSPFDSGKVGQISGRGFYVDGRKVGERQ